MIISLNRLIDEPPANSRQMRAYMQAILEVTGLLAQQHFPLEMFMKNYRTHLEPKSNYPHATLTKLSNGQYSITPEGYTYFTSRLTRNPIVSGQEVGRDEVVEMIRAIVVPEPQRGWQKLQVELDENT